MIFPAKRVTQVVDVISTPSCFKFRELAVMKQLIFKVTPATHQCPERQSMRPWPATFYLTCSLATSVPKNSFLPSPKQSLVRDQSFS